MLAAIGLGIVAMACSSASGQAADPQALSPEQRLALRRTPVVQVFEASKDAVVNISATTVVRMRQRGIDSFFEDLFELPQPRTQVRQYTSVGSGFVLHPAGYIVTNAHVVARTAERKAIFSDQREYEAQVVAIDEQRDLAVLKINADRPLTSIPLGTSADLMVGESVIAIGNPLGYQHTVTAGVVSALNRRLDVSENVAFENLIQTDASINPGNSGGPLLNILGELVGVNTAIRADAQNIGFAISVDQLRQILPELLDVERRYRIDIGLTLSNGQAEVGEVAANSAAQRAGLQRGDRIVAIDGQPLRHAIDYHIALLGRKAGEPIPMQVQRQGKAVALSLTPDARPRPDGTRLLRERFGIVGEPLTRKMASALNLPSVQGLMVQRVEDGSPADQIGLERGDVIDSLGRYQITSMDDVGELLENVQAGQSVRVEILRVSGRVVYRASSAMRAR
jgi:serine protease Do